MPRKRFTIHDSRFTNEAKILNRVHSDIVSSEKGALPIVLIIAAIGLIAFVAIASTASFKDRLFSSLFPKPPSQAQEAGRTPATDFIVQSYAQDDTTNTQLTSFNVRDNIKVKVKVASDLEASYKFFAKINYATDMLDVVSVNLGDPATAGTSNQFFIPSDRWIDPGTVDEAAGQISLVGAVPAPFLKTDPAGPRALMATIIFKATAAGTAYINFGPATRILRKSDDADILQAKHNLQLTLTDASTNPTATPPSAVGTGTTGGNGSQTGLVCRRQLEDLNDDGKVNSVDVGIMYIKWSR